MLAMLNHWCMMHDLSLCIGSSNLDNGAGWVGHNHTFVQESGFQLPLRQRTHSIERAPDDLLSPKSQVQQAQAATSLETPAQNPFSTFSSACKQPPSLA